MWLAQAGAAIGNCMRDQRQPEQISILGSGPLQTRQRILALAEQLYVLHGHDGFSFGDIAALVDTTRANIHHHFGNKRRLIVECRTLPRMRLPP